MKVSRFTIQTPRKILKKYANLCFHLRTSFILTIIFCSNFWSFSKYFWLCCKKYDICVRKLESHVFDSWTNIRNIFQVASVTTVEYANEILRKLFLGQYHKSLLILDDVWSSQIIKSFDVCAKVLVTTQDITVLDVISKNNVNVVKMQPFTQEESSFCSYNKRPSKYGWIHVHWKIPSC